MVAQPATGAARPQAVRASGVARRQVSPDLRDYISVWWFGGRILIRSLIVRAHNETKSDSLGDHDGSQLRERGSSAAAAVVDRRLTRSRARELGLGMENAAWPELGGRKGKKRGLAAEEGPKELESLPEQKNLEEQEQEGMQMSVPARGVGPRKSCGNCRDRGSMISKRDGLVSLI